jgi:hypothetical protein
MPVLKGTAYWASVTTPNTKYEPVYTVNLVPEDESLADDFKSRGYSIKEVEGHKAIVIKRKVNGPNGMVREAPRLVDSSKNPLDCMVGNGSEVKVQYKEWETTNKYGTFKGLDFQALQVLKLVEMGAPDGAEFDAETSVEDEL